MGLGLGTMEIDAPHGAEVHPDGYEILYVLSGNIEVREVRDDSSLGQPIALGFGKACIVRKGEWHIVQILGKT